MHNQVNAPNEALDPWIVTAYWDGGSKTITSKVVVRAKSRSDAIRAAKEGFAINASRTWAIKDCPMVRSMAPSGGKNLKRLTACTS